MWYVWLTVAVVACVALVAASYVICKYLLLEHRFSALLVLLLLLSVLPLAIVPADIASVNEGGRQDGIESVYFTLILVSAFLLLVAVPNCGIYLYLVHYTKNRSDAPRPPPADSDPLLPHQSSDIQGEGEPLSFCANLRRAFVNVSAETQRRTKFEMLAFFVGMAFLSAIIIFGWQTELKPAAGIVGNRGAWFAQVYSGGTAKRIAAIVFAVLAIAGMPAFVIFTAYGIAYIPFALLWGARAPEEYAASRGKLEKKLSTVRNAISALRSEGVRSNWVLKSNAVEVDSMANFMTMPKREDAEKLVVLEKKEKNYSELLGKCERSDSRSGKCCLYLGRFVFLVPGIGLLVFAFSIVSAMVYAHIIALKDSSCGSLCAYVVESSFNSINPIDWAMLTLSKNQPADLIVLSAVIIYLYIACFFGVAMLGRTNFMRVRRGVTTPMTFAAVVALLMLSVFAALAQFVFAAPHYFAFGAQTVTGSSFYCDMMTLGFNTNCQFTQLTRIVFATALAKPWVADIFFFSGFAFPATFSLFYFFRLFRGRPQYISSP